MIDLPDGKKCLMIVCPLCRVVWKKHYKRIQTTQNTGKAVVTLERWMPSKEMHVCKPKEEIIRKDWD